MYKLYLAIILTLSLTNSFGQEIESLFVKPKKLVRLGMYSGISHQSATKLFGVREFDDLGFAERSLSLGIQLDLFPDNRFNFKLRSAYTKAKNYNRGYNFSQSILANVSLGTRKKLYLHTGLLTAFKPQRLNSKFKFAHSLGIGYLIPIYNRNLFIEFEHILFTENYALTFNDDENQIHIKYFNLNVGIKF